MSDIHIFFPCRLQFIVDKVTGIKEQVIERTLEEISCFDLFPIEKITDVPKVQCCNPKLVIDLDAIYRQSIKKFNEKTKQKNNRAKTSLMKF